jgi:DtxR family Mn-dependent transcriptional regulator
VIKVLNRAEEDYIKAIYELTIQNDQPMIKTNEISEYFGFTDQSVNEMIKKLNQKKFVNFIPYKGINLTNKGKKEAIRMIRAHRIWEVFLTDKLGISWEDVHEDAEKLEHATSERVLSLLYDYIGKPDFCQHGNPIPNLQGDIKKASNFSLASCKIGDTFKLTRVLDLKALLIYLNEGNIKLNDELIIIEKDEFNEIIKVKHHEEHKTISMKTAKMLFGTR